jgi:DNA mismatch endonuclease (patch repair protein)
MRSVRQRGTDGEIAVEAELLRLGLEFERDSRVDVLGCRRRIDFVFRVARVAVFIDGCFWHGCPDHATWPRANAKWWRDKIHGNRLRDADTDLRLTLAGWTSVRVWTHEPPSAVAQRIAEAVKASGPTS